MLLVQYRFSRRLIFHLGLLGNPQFISMFYFLPTLCHGSLVNGNQSFIGYWLWFFVELVILDDNNIHGEGVPL